ncbi:hypothetical protein HDU88_000832 [Geranomyces variabilis]|nr:hypothetical protein HDU88_000832 [Geranomyces variabilis]
MTTDVVTPPAPSVSEQRRQKLLALHAATSTLEGRLRRLSNSIHPQSLPAPEKKRPTCGEPAHPVLKPAPRRTSVMVLPSGGSLGASAYAEDAAARRRSWANADCAGHLLKSKDSAVDMKAIRAAARDTPRVCGIVESSPVHGSLKTNLVSNIRRVFEKPTPTSAYLLRLPVLVRQSTRITQAPETMTVPVAPNAIGKLARKQTESGNVAQTQPAGHKIETQSVLPLAQGTTVQAIFHEFEVQSVSGFPISLEHIAERPSWFKYDESIENSSDSTSGFPHVPEPLVPAAHQWPEVQFLSNYPPPHDPRLPIAPARITHYPMSSFIQWDSDGSDAGSSSDEFEYNDGDDAGLLPYIPVVPGKKDPDGLDPEDRAIFEKYYRRKGCSESLDEFCPHVLDTISEFSGEGDEDEEEELMESQPDWDRQMMDVGMEIPCVMGGLLPKWPAEEKNATLLADECEAYFGADEQEDEAVTAGIPPALPRVSLPRTAAALVQRCEIPDGEPGDAAMPTEAVESCLSTCLLTTAPTVPQVAFYLVAAAVTAATTEIRKKLPSHNLYLITACVAVLFCSHQLWLAVRGHILVEHRLWVDFAQRCLEQGWWLVAVGHTILALAVGSWILGVWTKA